MIKTLRLLAIAGLLAASTAAQAASYEFSYNFLNGDVVSGSFDGTETAGIVTDWSKFSMRVNGGAVQTNFLTFGTTSLEAAASFDGLSNDFFVFSFNGYALTSGPFMRTGVTDAINYVSPDAQYGEGDGAFDAYSPSRWQLHAVTAVPEPATYAMLMGGLALLGAAARRRKMQA